MTNTELIAPETPCQSRIHPTLTAISKRICSPVNLSLTTNLRPAMKAKRSKPELPPHSVEFEEAVVGLCLEVPATHISRCKAKFANVGADVLYHEPEENP